MKRTPLKRKTPLRKYGKSERSKLIKDLDKLFRLVLIKKRGDIDEITGNPGNRLGTFHIMPKGAYPRLRYSERNCLLVNWFPAHFSWHHDNPGHKTYDMVLRRIKELRGDDYVEKLKMQETMADKISMSHLRLLKCVFEKELEEK